MNKKDSQSSKSQNSVDSFRYDPKENPARTKSNAIEIPSISLPKGGGAIRGIDEKFSVNAANGTASFSIPLPITPARGATPNLNLSYNSGSGNGIFGLGWNLSLPSIKRKTDKGLPQYRDNIDSDVFLFSEAEDLVPAYRKKADGSFELDNDGQYIIDETDSSNGVYRIRNYRPRIEGLFARIERWSDKSTREISWRVMTKDNTTTLFGWSERSRIADPQNPQKIFEWLPEFVFDDKGNCAHYIYRREDEKGLDQTLTHNCNRFKDGKISYTNLYLGQVNYGNKTPYGKLNDPFPSADDYMFSVVLDFGEFNPVSPYNKIANKTWDFRADAFSDYRAGFEVRTTRLCTRVLVFHHFKGEDEYEGLVKSLDFDYNTTAEAGFTFLRSITSRGYIKISSDNYSDKALPALEFSYQKHEWNKEVKSIGTDDSIHAPIGLDDQQYQFTDYENEGLSGILTEQAGGLYYKHNLSDGKFAPAKLVSPKPSWMGLGTQLQLADLDADGGKQLVSYDDPAKGYFELHGNNEWLPFTAFKNLPNHNFRDPNMRMLDLNGDGKPEAVISGETVFTWYESEGRDGFSREFKTEKSLDEESGPAIVFADRTQSIYLADMSGDGLTDIVRIKNGEVCYWPNLGYGKFGAKITLDNAPVFDHHDAFNPSYLRLADIDGSGTTDIIYLGKNKFTCWKNLSGNRFASEPFEIDPFPEIHADSKISVIDLLGNGLSCIVWSSPLLKDASAPLRYIDLMKSTKPHVMVAYRNNMGKEVSVEYIPSTKFYIEDKLAGKPWVTKLHFPVLCVSRSITEDKISGHKFISSYKYHHGYYDHAEREFRGFGMVEQIDAETFEHWKKSSATNITEKHLHQEPVVTKSWFHTGAFMSREKILDQFSHEYWHEEFKRQGFVVTHHEAGLPDAKVVAAPGVGAGAVTDMTTEEWREALRTCKGMALRKEVFAHDASQHGDTPEAKRRALIPYSVAESNCSIELLQPKGKNKHAVFAVRESESITYSYERNPEDPRVAHTLNVKLDEYGNVLESASVVYPRLKPDTSLPPEVQLEQQKTSIIYSLNKYSNDVIAVDTYRLRLPSEAQTLELTGVRKSQKFYSIAEFHDVLGRAQEIPYHLVDNTAAAGIVTKRSIEHVRTLYSRDDLGGALPLYKLESLALPFENYQLAYTPELLYDIFGSKVDDHKMIEGRFVHGGGDNNWWIRSGITQFKTMSETSADARARFYAPLSYTDPYGAITRIKYYSSYFLFVEETEDALGNKNRVEQFNFRTLSPRRMKDLNGNLSEVITDELGMVKASAVFGKGDEADDLDGLSEFTGPGESTRVDNFFSAPDSVQLTNIGKDLLQHATARIIYDLNAYVRSGAPIVAASIVREEHYKSNTNSPVQISFEYSSGLGKVIMKKAQAEPGSARQVTVNDDNSIIVNEIKTNELNPVQLRWIGSGRTILNNKGNAVKQYEPYFSVTHQFENVKALVESGVTPIIYYDALGRVIKTEMPDGTFSKVEFDSWKQSKYDANDTVLESLWYRDRVNRSIDAKLVEEGKDPVREKLAAEKTARHANTPLVVHLDTLGRIVLTVEHNKNRATGDDEFHATRGKLDTEGNLRKVTDARGNVVMQYKYDMLGNMVYQKSMDAGQRWLLTNIVGNPLRTWDERSHEFQFEYDILHRPTQTRVVGGDGTVALNNVIDRIIYGESLLNADRTNEETIKEDNVLGKVIRHYDTGGLIDTPEYDFKGQPVSTSRMLFKHYKEVANWVDANLIGDLEDEDPFTFATQTDALGRIVLQNAPDESIITPSYNEAGLLNGETILHKGAPNETVYIKDIHYNEKGQRSKIVYGNNVATKFHYDKETFRLKRLETKRQNNDLLQDLYYTYDAVGNITHIEDKNIQVTFFNNQKIEGLSEYTYDALYRLIEASGRENDAALNYTNQDNWNDSPFMQEMSVGDPMSMRNYTQQYAYDGVGNITRMRHTATGNNWTRDYTYETTNNRLRSTTIGSRVYNYPHHLQHGFMTTLPHLEEIGWNFKEELVKSIRQRRTDGGAPETTYYQYDGQGQRIRKITEREADVGVVPTLKDERIYISGYELYKSHSGANEGLERTSLSLMDEGHRFVMIDTETEPRTFLGLPAGRTSPKQTTRYQLHNHQGSASLELDESAQVIGYEEYHPYGTTSFQAKNTAIAAAAKRYRYTGMERDEETGLEYHSARYYLPWLGRWMSGDPTGLKAGHNLFNFCNGNPVNRTDNEGMDWKFTWKPWEWEPVKFTKEEIAPKARVFSGNVVGTLHALVGYETDRELGPDQAAGYKWAQDTFGWQKSKAVQELRDGIINDPYASKIMAGTLGLMSAFVPGAPSGDDLPESMRETYKMMKFASTNATMIVSAGQSFQSGGFTPPSAPAVATNTGTVLVQAAPGAFATPATIPLAVAMVSGGNSGNAGNGQSNPEKPKETHKAAATKILKENQGSRSNQTVLTAKVKLKSGKEIKVATPNTPANGQDPAWRPGQMEAAQRLGYTPVTPKNTVPGMHAEENLGAYLREQGGGSVLEWAVARGENATSFICKSATCRVFTTGWGPQEFK